MTKLNFTALLCFNANLPTKPYCSQDLTHLSIRPKAVALQYPYIQVNDPFNVGCLPFDLDLGWDSANSWNHTDSTDPNLIVQNSENGHCHYLYFLKTPVWCRHSGRDAPEAYLNAIRAAMTAKLHADHRYAGLICKNPFNSQWRTLELHHSLFSLDDLAKNLDLSQKTEPRTARQLENVTLNGRNDRLFTLLRFFAYSQVQQCRDKIASLGRQQAFALWNKYIHHEADNINREFPNGLALNEVRSTAKSVSQWVWKHYHPSEKCNRGKLGFGITRHNFNFDVPRLALEEIKHRQRLSAEATNEARKAATEAKIKQAIEQLQAANQKVTRAAVAKMTGLDRTKLSLNYGDLFN
jgi:hypothetical protein